MEKIQQRLREMGVVDETSCSDRYLVMHSQANDLALAARYLYFFVKHFLELIAENNEDPEFQITDLRACYKIGDPVYFDILYGDRKCLKEDLGLFTFYILKEPALALLSIEKSPIRSEERSYGATRVSFSGDPDLAKKLFAVFRKHLDACTTADLRTMVHL